MSEPDKNLFVLTLSCVLAEINETARFEMAARIRELMQRVKQSDQDDADTTKHQPLCLTIVGGARNADVPLVRLMDAREVAATFNCASESTLSNIAHAMKTSWKTRNMSVLWITRASHDLMCAIGLPAELMQQLLTNEDTRDEFAKEQVALMAILSSASTVRARFLEHLAQNLPCAICVKTPSDIAAEDRDADSIRTHARTRVRAADADPRTHATDEDADEKDTKDADTAADPVAAHDPASSSSFSFARGTDAAESAPRFAARVVSIDSWLHRMWGLVGSKELEELRLKELDVWSRGGVRVFPARSVEAYCISQDAVKRHLNIE